MAVQLLENWLLKEQEKIQTKYRHLNQVSVLEPDILFIGDSIVEYYPLQELFGNAKTIVNRGIRGYQTGLLLENLDAHLYGGAVDKIVLLIGTNDMGKDVPVNEEFPVNRTKLAFQNPFRLEPKASRINPEACL